MTGGLHPEAERFLRELAEMHNRQLPVDLVGESWTATSFVSYFLQRLSSAVNMAAAAEIRAQIVKSPCHRPRSRGGLRHRAIRAA